MSTEDSVTQLETAFTELHTMTRNLDSRMDDHLSWINELGAAQANTERKIAALVDAQIRTEDALVRLADAQARTESKLDALIDVVREMRGGS